MFQNWCVPEFLGSKVSGAALQDIRVIFSIVHMPPHYHRVVSYIIKLEWCQGSMQVIL